ncbi:sugar isomerase [Leptospira perolatii]|uniref:Sugar isomerase n=1 Tax=Leptospira perolatii TaxID=2023191 RepID=A0A2M9ZLF9_9LEPT|nr:SIS domain-containing protein [Leptospira perolatii]PJZ70305.1 sugar isomerase [Leptospira perolatii]PJZ72811.1 sugar isomerase [Leptospira perolatii]
MNQLDKIFENSAGPKEFAEGYLQHLSDLLGKLNTLEISNTINEFLKVRENGKKILFLGNGGSAATASHFVNDIAVGTRKKEKPFKAIGLTDNIAAVTAIANDDGYENIFVKQLEYLLEPGDLVVAISASGNSPNVIKAVEYAKGKGNRIVGLTGFDGGKLGQLSDILVHVETAKGEYGPVEDIHMVMDHLIGSYLNRVP